MKKTTLLIAVFSILFLSRPFVFLFAEDVSEKKEEYYGSCSQQTWQAYNNKDYDSAEKIIDKCVALFDAQAKEMQGSLQDPIPTDGIHRYWPLNDVATIKFVKGKIYMEKGDIENAKLMFMDVVKNYKYAMAYDNRGWYWNVSEGAKDMLLKLKKGVDFGDASSTYLTQKAWELYNEGKYEEVFLYADKCIELYSSAALIQQGSLTRYPREGKIAGYWALNDVGTCYYIAGMASVKLGDADSARKSFTFLKEHLYYASSWDNKGWHWMVAQAADKELKNLK